MKKASNKPILYIDAQCPFCRHWAAKVSKHTDGQISIRPLSQASLNPSLQKRMPSDTAIFYDRGQVLTHGQLIRKYLEWRFGKQHIFTQLSARSPLAVLNGIYRLVAWGRPLWSAFYRSGG